MKIYYPVWGRNLLWPDYRRGSLLNLMASIAARFGHDIGYGQASLLPGERLRPHRRIVLIVIDGLGYRLLQEWNGSGFLAIILGEN